MFIPYVPKWNNRTVSTLTLHTGPMIRKRYFQSSLTEEGFVRKKRENGPEPPEGLDRLVKRLLVATGLKIEGAIVPERVEDRLGYLIEYTPYVRGSNLESARFRVKPGRPHSLALLGTLEELHGTGYAHGDARPLNWIAGRRPYLIDFETLQDLDAPYRWDPQMSGEQGDTFEAARCIARLDGFDPSPLLRAVQSSDITNIPQLRDAYLSLRL